MRFNKKFASYYNDILLNEGLISSWDVDKLLEKIKKILGVAKIETIESGNVLDGILQADTKYGKVFTSDIILKEPPTEYESSEIDKILDLFGYADSLKMGKDRTQIRLEPKFPVDVSRLIPDNSILFHISQKKYDKRIQRIGLSPRFTETSSYHDGERIYLLYIAGNSTEKSKILNGFINVLARDKKVTPDKMSIWKTGKQPNTTYYHDDTTSIPIRGILGIFVKQNIPSEKISKSF